LTALTAATRTRCWPCH